MVDGEVLCAEVVFVALGALEEIVSFDFLGDGMLDMIGDEDDTGHIEAGIVTGVVQIDGVLVLEEELEGDGGVAVDEADGTGGGHGDDFLEELFHDGGEEGGLVGVFRHESKDGGSIEVDLVVGDKGDLGIGFVEAFEFAFDLFS